MVIEMHDNMYVIYVCMGVRWHGGMRAWHRRRHRRPAGSESAYLTRGNLTHIGLWYMGSSPRSRVAYHPLRDAGLMDQPKYDTLR